MKRKRTKRILTAVCALGITAFAAGGFGLINENVISSQAEESFSAAWTVHENSDIVLSDVREGGVGTVTYRTVPAEDGSLEHPYGHPDGPVFNSVRIPCKGYDISDDRVSIKYDADFPVNGRNVTVYAATTEDVGSDGSDLAAGSKLIGWFENWNVTSGQSKDGFKYVTINHANYTDFRTVNGIILQFNYEGDAETDKTIRILGVDFHLSTETPEFVTDPQPFSVSGPVAENCTATQEADGCKVGISGKGTISYSVSHWDSRFADRIIVDCRGFEGGTLTPVFDGTRGAAVALSADRRALELPFGGETLDSLALEFTGTGEAFIYGITSATAPKTTSWSTSNGSYFDAMEELNDPVYKMHYKRNATAGYPKVIVSVEDWRADYDVICLDINVLSGKVLTGILLSDSHYLLTHWDADNVLGVGKHSLTFFYPLEIDPDWDGKQFTIYVNPSSVSVDGYTYDAEFEIGIGFMKSESLPSATISVGQESYEFKYDGQPKSVSASVSPAGTPFATTYVRDGKESKDAPKEVGEYTVRFVVEGSREIRRTVREVRMNIIAVEQEPPAQKDWKFDYDNGTLVFLTEGLEASASAEFDTLIENGGAVTPGSTVYIRRAASEGGLASAAISAQVPQKPQEKPNLTLVELTRTKIVVKAEGNVEYRLIRASNAGEWKSEGSFVGLKADTLYRIEARVKATETTFAGDAEVLAVRTKLTNDSPDSGSSVEESAASSGNGGCGSVLSLSGISALSLLSAGLCVLRRRRQK